MYQLAEYYRYGDVNSCDGRWAELMNALKQRRAMREGSERTSAREDTQRERSLEGKRKEEMKPMWTTATPSEASRAWRATFKENVPSAREVDDAREAFMKNSGQVASEREK